MQANVLSYLPSDENSITTLLMALCVLKPIREIVIRLFTQNKFGTGEVEFEGMLTQFDIGGAIPDMVILAEELRVVVEIKVSDWRGLTANQPQIYLQWLAKQAVANKFFVFLVPPHYAEQHRQEYAKQKDNFCTENPGHAINFIEINWLDLASALDESGLPSTSIYARDFQNLIEVWYSYHSHQVLIS